MSEPPEFLNVSPPVDVHPERIHDETTENIIRYRLFTTEF